MSHEGDSIASLNRLESLIASNQEELKRDIDNRFGSLRNEVNRMKSHSLVSLELTQITNLLGLLVKQTEGNRLELSELSNRIRDHDRVILPRVASFNDKQTSTYDLEEANLNSTEIVNRLDGNEFDMRVQVNALETNKPPTLKINDDNCNESTSVNRQVKRDTLDSIQLLFPVSSTDNFTDQEECSEFVLNYARLNFKESKSSLGIFTAFTKKMSYIAFGKLKFAPKAEKTKTKTGQYVTHFNVVYGTLLLKCEGHSDSIVKTGFYFQVDKRNQYSITNLMNDEALIDFTIINYY